MSECFIQESEAMDYWSVKVGHYIAFDNITSVAIPFREVDFICDDPFWEVQHLIINSS